MNRMIPIALILALSAIASCAGKPPTEDHHSEIEQALLSHKTDFRGCYEKELQGKKELAGKVDTKFTIGSDGKTRDLSIESTTLKNKNTEDCILGVIQKIDFPKPAGGGTVQVTYPFKFHSEK